MKAVAAGTPLPAIALHELTAMIDRHNALQPTQETMFAEVKPQPTKNLAQVFEAMKARGYLIGEPVRFTPSSLRSHTEWHVPVAHGRWSAVLRFYVEEQTC